MAEHYLWRLSSVKVQAMRAFGISESHCKRVSINILSSEVQEKKPSSSPLAGQTCQNSEPSSPSPGRSRFNL